VALYHGILETISGGNVVSSAPSHVWASEGLGGTTRVHQGGFDPHRNWVNRQFVDIGGQRLTNVMVTQLCDELLLEAIGEEVTLAVFTPSNSRRHRQTVLGVRTPKMGVVKPGLATLLLGAIWGSIKVWIAAIVLTLFSLLPAGVVGKIFGRTPGLLVLAAGVVLAIWLVAASLRGYVRMIGVWRSLPRGEPSVAALPVA
jgi:hypothetical protein